MLSLSRRAGELILIGDDISVRVHSVLGNRVRLAIDAPREVPIRRSELLPAATFHSADENQSKSHPHVLPQRCGRELLNNQHT